MGKGLLMKKERIAGIDIVKTLAVIFVISIHQIGMTHILAMDMAGARSFIIMVYRYTVMSCVPLFLMATGYLQRKKEPTKRFYKGLIPIIASYLFSSVLAVWVNVNVVGKGWDLWYSIIHILNFTENNYAWYVEMFIGLYLLIPFLNKMYNAIEKKSEKKLLIFILMFLTVSPSIFLIFNDDKYYYDIMPDYWTIMYPITYYMLGAYFNEYKPRINKLVNMVLILCAALFPTIIEFAVAKGGEFVDHIMNGFNSLSAMLIAIFVFMFFYDLDIKAKPVKTVVRDISVASLEIYLLSNLVEKCLYPHIPDNTPMRLPLMIILVFIGSYIAAKIQRVIFRFIKFIFMKKTYEIERLK